MELRKLVGKKLKSVTLNPSKDLLSVEMEDGATADYGVEGDCCSSSWIEHLTVPDDVAGATVVSVDEQTTDSFQKDYESIEVYETRIRTNRGDVVMEYRNSSNGYYGGYLVER